MTKAENHEQAGFNTLKERIEFLGGDAAVLDELETRYPGLSASLEIVTNASTSNDDFFKALDVFNDSHTYKKEGQYRSLGVAGDHGDVTVKYFENGSIAISASWLR